MRPALILFLVGLLLRTLGWLLSPERSLAWTAAYQGDAPVWGDLLLGRGGLEAVLPFRPPGTLWFVAAIWDGGPDASWARCAMVLLGAAVAPAVYLALRRGFARDVAIIAAGICACSHSLAVLGSGMHGELPYLLLFVLSVPDFERLRAGPARGAAVRWGLLQALASLLRADHLLVTALLAGWLCWTKQGARARDLGLAATAFVLGVLPWQWHAMAVVADYNRTAAGRAQPLDPPPNDALPWDPVALDEVRELPAFCRRPILEFVDATVRARGGLRVDAGAPRTVVVEAFGSWPEPLRTPVIALYGPLNFFLANSAESDGGFTRAPLDRRPPLAGGPGRYPPGLIDVLPGSDRIELSYPPHLRALNDGYGTGLEWLWQNPAAGLRLFGDKLVRFWRGAATGIGGAALPLGRSGVREPVDLVAAQGATATAWGLLLLCAAAFGAMRLRREPAAAAWMLFLAAKVATTVAFFGYARFGALCVPSLALCWAAAAAPALRSVPAGARRTTLWVLLTALLSSEMLLAHHGTAPRIAAPPGAPRDARVEVGY